MKPIIEYPDFEKLELRIGKVVEASAPAWSNKLLAFMVDFGPEFGTRSILSGVRKWYQPEDFLNKKYVFVINLAERKMGEGVSQGMMIMADAVIGDELRPVIFPVDDAIPAGSQVR